jgi:hypothetical protein
MPNVSLDWIIKKYVKLPPNNRVYPDNYMTMASSAISPKISGDESIFVDISFPNI